MPALGGFAPSGIIQTPSLGVISSHDIRHVDRAGAVTAASGTNTAWVSGLAVYVPFVLCFPVTVYEWWVMNGTLTTAHNINFGLYNPDFTAIQRLGSTAGATTASALINTSTWTDLRLNPGAYYMAYLDDSTRNLSTSADLVHCYQSSGIMEQTGLGSTLPDPMVPVTYTRAFLPHFGMNFRSTAL